MDDGYHITEGLDEPLRRMLDTAMDELEALRERGHEAIQYPDEPTYVIDPQDVWDHTTRALYAVQNAVAILTGEEPLNDV